MANLKNIKVGILGLGQENIALAHFLALEGAKITVCDIKKQDELAESLEQIKGLKLDYRLGPDYLDNLSDFEIVFRTPGLSILNPKLQKAKEDGLEISSEIKLFFNQCPCKIIGVTGTKGKGTTTTLIYEILSEARKKGKILGEIYIGGNIGNPPINFLKKLKQEDTVVLELSSFQLQDLNKSPNIAVVLDIKVDHLDYHKDEEEYKKAKANILNFQKKDDFAVVNADYLTSFELAILSQGEIYWFSRRKSVDQGVWVKNGKEIFLRFRSKDYPIIKTSDITLRGEHNWENISASIAAAVLAGADLNSVRKVVQWFPGLEHRLEFIAQIGGIKYYNDSFSTTPDTAIAAIKSFMEPIILIAGGSEKGADYKELGEVISSSKVKTAILIGKTGPKIKRKIKNKKIKIITNCNNIDQAVEKAKDEAKSGDVVLLSPASASFDWFKNYKDRGDQFKKTVRAKEGIITEYA